MTETALIGDIAAIPEDDIEPGIYVDIPHEEYLRMPGLSVSKLKLFSEDGGPAKVKSGFHKETAAMRLGTLWHCAVLEADQLERRYAPTYLDRRGTKAWADAEAMAMGRELIKRPDYEEALRVRDAVFKHPTARALLGGLNSVEQSIFWRDPMTGLLCRGRADGIRTDLRAILDVKTTLDASKAAFAKTAAEYKYHWQNAMYEDGVFEAEGWMPEAFLFIAIEKEDPWLVGTYEIDCRDVDHARREVREQINRYAICLRDDVWPGYSDHIETINLPAWAFKEKT